MLPSCAGAEDRLRVQQVFADNNMNGKYSFSVRDLVEIPPLVDTLR